MEQVALVKAKGEAGELMKNNKFQSKRKARNSISRRYMMGRKINYKKMFLKAEVLMVKKIAGIGRPS